MDFGNLWRSLNRNVWIYYFSCHLRFWFWLLLCYTCRCVYTDMCQASMTVEVADWAHCMAGINIWTLRFSCTVAYISGYRRSCLCVADLMCTEFSLHISFNSSAVFTCFLVCRLVLTEYCYWDLKNVVVNSPEATWFSSCWVSFSIYIYTYINVDGLSLNFPFLVCFPEVGLCDLQPVCV
jgi:hypothetical protein